MQRIVMALVLVAIAFAAGWWARPLWTSTDASAVESDANAQAEPLYWVAPMDPNYRRDKPGKSPMGMDLVPVYEEDQGGSDDGGVTIAPRIVSSLGVRIAEATEGALELPIETVGRVMYDEDQLVHVHSRVSGWVEKLQITATGDPVSKGTTLMELYSPDLVYAQEEFLLARRMNDPRMKRSARNKLLVLGITERQVNELDRRGEATQRIRIEAPEGGFVSSLNIREGMFITPDTEVMAIGSLASVWVIGEVFERHAGLVEPGQAVEISVPAFPGESWTGEVDFIYPELDAQTRTLRVRIRVPNPDQRLRPNMFVDLRLNAPIGDNLLSIPREALIRDGRHPRVILSEGDGRFRPVPVSPGREVGDRVVVIEGLTAGQQVVTSAQFLIDSETNLDAALARLEEAEPEEPKPEQVEVGATVTGLMPEMGMIALEHEPIPAWDWPTMKMDFELADGVELPPLEVGDPVVVQIRDAGDWTYIIEGIEAAGASSATEQTTPERVVEATGEVREVIAGPRLVTVVHDPIPEWQWPKMTMTFEVAEDVDFDQLTANQRIEFRLRETEQGDYRLESFQPLK
ncbi:efflux RND transporter periplasmic adaptor subunit [Marinobacter salinisoli]|uniref:Efflux RND transporter periplasmic adaptor subunit n=1 Tax=Marinobacter salinisoli TaxID=2769486 RepID=A0ABX7MTS6_9GAMM|nr:efflux RND transporter periplasmic adaptor subunit [Marinobacter salinisoli]QSP95736.1 efflux RND transporter periplasmic adaptor subunit [Marinobacter salinisoli]